MSEITVERLAALTEGTAGLRYAERQQLRTGDVVSVLETAVRRVRRSLVFHVAAAVMALLIAALDVMTAPSSGEGGVTRLLDLPWLRPAYHVAFAIGFLVTARGRARNLRELGELLADVRRRT